MAKTNAQKVFELTRFAAELVAQRHRRERPEATEDDVDEVVAAWYSSRPQAPDGDGEGVSRSWSLGE